ncbi:hypothetical protein BGZ96_005454 [Linnemannia gamsii]|uniref:Carbohydrate-binding module family 96 domain-containing protein n=1 Tax=Linnemannia gamsii TaxID=64522 RepID=A0ABQ7JHA6_9FUNG|nr:hypothetical protein BGZ96_005454 [Linnemannia gamsii]
MKFFASSALNAAAIGLAQAYTTNIRVARDATVLYTGSIGALNLEIILLGFDLPAKSISKCMLKIPHPIEVATNGEYALSVAVTDNNWAEDTVSGANKSLNGIDIGSVLVAVGLKPGDIDVTSSCQGAMDGKLSLFVESQPASTHFNSIQSGSPAIFSLDVTY